MFARKSLYLLFLLPFFLLEAQLPRLADDSDISGDSPSQGFFSISDKLEWDETISEASEDVTSLQILRRNEESFSLVKGLLLTDNTSGEVYTNNEQGFYVFPSCDTQENFSLTAKFQNGEYFRIQDGRNIYSINIELSCGTKTSAIAAHDSATGQVLGIWQVATQAKQRLENSVGLEFWTWPLKFHFPATGDYYQWNGNLYITRGDHWDVVAHEMGHAIYDLANIGAWGGGQHYIDRCYTNSMALSEGWASFYASFVMLERTDTDAKFEFMVPRRAPIAIEHVPNDVCWGPTNEWRVTSFLWDLYDLNTDNESAEFYFKKLWQATYSKNYPSVEKLKESLIEQNFNRELVEAAWTKNFVQ